MFSKSSNLDRRASAEATLVQVLLSLLAGATWSWLAFLRRCDAIGEFAIAFSLTCLTTTAIFACVEVRALASASAYRRPGFLTPARRGQATCTRCAPEQIARWTAKAPPR